MQPLFSGGLQAKPFFFAATKIRIERGPRRCYDHCRRNRSSSRQRRIEQTRTSSLLRLLQAEPFSFAATKNRIGRGHRSRHGRSRRNHSPLPLRKLESGAEDCCRDDCFRRAIPHCCDDGAAVIPKFTLSNQESLQCKMRFQAKSCIDSQVWA